MALAGRQQRHATIRTILGGASVASQGELRRELATRGFKVTQATLSRDVHDLQVFKGPQGYSINSAAPAAELKPQLAQVLRGFGVSIRQALNLLVLATNPGSAQPVAAGLDRQQWQEVLGTIAGDDTVLIICADERQAKSIKSRIEANLA